ncbi:hypothetical protein OIU77_027569 [Salix suchowensis]|uniref:MSP domain-containing protein n=1 Tax=Salix suchowensis TaxID=1278906 RepID=A0ABQ9BRU8_9ROSI|nr:hypothetical protein OIU77_027569 [Salix suchowensis]
MYFVYGLVELKKQISCSLQLSNKTDNYVAFKVKTTNPKKYCVRPNAGIVLPRSTCDVIVTMQAQKEAPPDIHCKDKFLLQSVKANDGVTAKDINAEMFSKEAGHLVEECKLRVLYVSPPQPPSPVHEGSEEGSSPRGSVSDNGNVNGADLSTATRAFVERLEPQEKSLEARALISKLTGEKNNAIQQNNKLRQELNISQGPLPVMHRFWSSKSIPEQQNKLSHLLIVVDRLKPLTVSANTNISASIVGLYSLAASGPSYLLSELLRHQGNKNRGGVSIMFVIFVGLLGIFLGYLVKKTSPILEALHPGDYGRAELDRRSSSDRSHSCRDAFDPLFPISSLSQDLNLMDRFLDNPFLPAASRGAGAAIARRGFDVKEDENGLLYAWTCLGSAKRMPR